MPKFSAVSLERLAACDPQLQALFRQVIEHFDCRILEGHRGKEKQDAYFADGLSKVQYPNSRHNALPSMAADVAPCPINWNDTKRFYYFAGVVMGIAADMGIQVRWGGDWDRDTEVNDQTFMDLPHFEIVG